MADVSHRRADLAGHPDVSEMRARYDRVLGGHDVVFVDGPVFLAGLYCAISPWVVANFAAAHPQLAIHNLIVGVALGLLALGFTMAPERMYGMSWAVGAIGAWLIIATWVVGPTPSVGIVLSNVILGGVVFLLGVLCVTQVMMNRGDREKAEA
jgi:hypothetical protein